MSLDQLQSRLRTFVRARDWEKFHAPKNLAMALTVEVAELLEHFQWLTPEESRQLPEKTRAAVEDEIGDVLIYLVRLCDELGINAEIAAERKVERNELKYPAELVRGQAKKYTEYG
jgi:dCTP diphosphatase